MYIHFTIFQKLHLTLLLNLKWALYGIKGILNVKIQVISMHNEIYNILYVISTDTDKSKKKTLISGDKSLYYKMKSLVSGKASCKSKKRD